MKPWYTRIDWEIVLAAAVMGMLLILLLLLLGVGFARAAGCLTIDVDPRYVVREMDGDTFPIFTFGPGEEIKIRVKGVQTPEREQPGWAEAKAFTKAWLNKGPFQVLTCGKKSLDRIEGIVTRDGESLAQALKDAGLGK